MPPNCYTCFNRDRCVAWAEARICVKETKAELGDVEGMEKDLALALAGVCKRYEEEERT